MSLGLLKEPPVVNPQRMAPLLEVSGLRKAYGGREVLKGVDLTVRRGEVVSLLGANGSGKSTVLKCIVGLTDADDGTIAIAGRPASGTSRKAHDAAMVFQQIHLVPASSVLQNVCAGALARLSLPRSWVRSAVPKAVREEAMACLDRVGLADRAHDRAGSLSGGQQQRVAVARALCQRAPVLLADEPVSALDPAASDQVMELLGSLARDDGMAVAAVLHQPHLARRYSDRLVGLTRGRIEFDAAPEELSERTLNDLYAPDRSQ